MRTHKKTSQVDLQKLQTERFLTPHKFVTESYDLVYKQNTFPLGTPKQTQTDTPHARKNTAAIVGVALGDEGKGRLVDNKIETYLTQKSIDRVVVIRFQGGNNAGHTVEKGKTKLALHLVPSGVLHKKAVNIIDRGVVVHPEDLQTEVTYVEKHTGDIKNRLYLSSDAIFCTDLERAEEVLNKKMSSSANGGTGRGIGPSYAHHYDKRGLKLYQLLMPDWEKTLSTYYDWYQNLFSAFDTKLSDVPVPDYNQTLVKKSAQIRTVGTKKEFLTRLKRARNWIIKKDIIRSPISFYKDIYNDIKTAVLFEGAQAAGLDAWLGTLPDVTASNTSIFGIREGTGFWRIQDVEEKFGVFKIPYTSSVGSRTMPTHVEIPEAHNEGSLTNDQKWASWVREEANEYGTTTGRPRDITHLDLPMLSYNTRISGVEMLIGTHLDTARKTDTIKVCTHYEDQNGNTLSYQPGLRHLTDVIPRYIELPGWDGKKCRTATKKSELPKTALQFLSFIQYQTGFPITAVTTGPDRKHIIYF